MPIYSFQNKDTGDIADKLMKWDDIAEYLDANPELKQVITGAPALVASTGDRTKPPGGFKELLSKISDANPTSALASDYGKKDPKSVKVREIVQKVAKKIGNISD